MSVFRKFKIKQLSNYDRYIINREPVNIVVAIGPVPMMKALCESTKKYEIHTMVSLNPIMVDGTGMCGACRVSVGDETKFACVDGPFFDGHLVDWDELWDRRAAYSDEEINVVGRTESVAPYDSKKHTCKCST